MSDAHAGEGHHAPPPLPEPKTPMWMPALGGALFVLAGAWWVGMPRTAPADAAASAGATVDAGQGAPSNGTP